MKHSATWGITFFKDRTIFLKIFSVLLFLLVVSFIFSSCRKNEMAPPTICLDTSSGLLFRDTILAPGTNFSVRIVAEMGDANITNIVIKNTHNGETISYFDTGVNNEQIAISKILTKNVYDSETWIFMAIDEKGGTASVSFTTICDTAAGYQDIKTYAGLILGAQNNSAYGSFLSLNSGHIWFQDDAFNVQDSVEMLYYYDSTGDANTIASPGANIGTFIYSGSTGPLNWTIRNETRFYKTTYTATDFNNVHNDSLLLVAYDAINSKRKAKNLVPGDVFAFKTTHTKYGMFTVENVTGTDEGSLQFSIKIQK